MKKSTQTGFTLVETMLAMAIFTAILLVVALVYLQIFRLFVASTSARAVQQNNRSIVDEITRSIQQGSIKPGGTSYVTVAGVGNPVICVGNTVFYADPVGATTHGFYEGTNPTPATCSSANATGVRTLSGTNVQVAAWSANLVQTPGPTPGSTVPSGVQLSLTLTTRLAVLQGGTCPSGTGTEYCAINTLTTTVVPRENN